MTRQEAFYIVGNIPIPTDDKNYDICQYQEAKAMALETLQVWDDVLQKLEDSDFHDIQMIVRETLLKHGFPYDSAIQNEIWNELDELSANKFAIKIIKQELEDLENPKQ